MKKYLLLFIIAAIWQTAKAQAESDTIWTRSTNYDIYDAKFSPDGSIIATGHSNGYVYLWETYTGKIIKQLLGPQYDVSSIAFSHDGKYLYAGTGDPKMIFKWDVNTFQLVKTFDKAWGGIWSIALTPDDSKLIVGNVTGADTSRTNIIILDAQTGELINYIHFGYSVSKIIISPDGKYFATLSSYQGYTPISLDLWDAVTYRHIHTIDFVNKSPMASLNDIAFSKDGTKLYEVLTGDIALKTFSIPDCQLIKTLLSKKIPRIFQAYTITRLALFNTLNKIFLDISGFDSLHHAQGEFGIYNFSNDLFDNFYSINWWGSKALDISSDDSKIVSALGQFLFLMNNKSTGVKDIITKQDNENIIMPNPIYKTALIKFFMPNSGQTKIILNDSGGRFIKQLFNGFCLSGKNEITVDLPDLSNGMYFITIQCGTFVLTLQLSIMK